MNNFSYFSKALDEVVDARLDDYVETLEVDKLKINFLIIYP
jgi:hypothetical protein